MTTKICSKCKEEKNIDQFYRDKNRKDGHTYQCKVCRDLYQDEYIKNNKDKRHNRAKAYNEKNKESIAIQKKEYNLKNKEKKREKSKEYNERTGYQKKYREENKDYLSQSNKEYRIKNKDKLNQKQRDKYNNDLDYKLYQTIRNLFRIKFKEKNIKKENKFFIYTGISFKEYFEHLQKDPLWNEYDSKNKKIHIDHIIPISIYNFLNEEDIKKCWNPKNLRLLPYKENLTKNNKIDTDLIKKHNIEHLLPEGFKI